MSEVQPVRNRCKIAFGHACGKSLQRIVRDAVLFAAVSCLAVSGGCAQQTGEQLSLHGRTMGTSYTIEAVSASLSVERARGDIDAMLADIDRQMSTWRDDSDISRFNANTSTGWIEVPRELATVTRVALSVSARSGGAFDVTVKPLVDLWGFGRSERERRPPDPEELRRVASRVGYGHLQVRMDGRPALRKAVASLEIDLSAIAKGYAVDRIAQYLLNLGVGDFLVEIGGELRVAGKNAQGRAWRVGVEQPSDDGTRIDLAITPGEGGVATSGDYRNFFMWQGRRFSHVLDPRTGEPATHALASATVVAQSAMLADAWATALLVVGAERALAIAEAENLAVHVVERRGEGYAARQSPGFQRYVTTDNH